MSIPQTESIQIGVDNLHKSELVVPTVPKALFIELLAAASMLVEFNFNYTVYKTD